MIIIEPKAVLRKHAVGHPVPLLLNGFPGFLILQNEVAPETGLLAQCASSRPS